MAADRTKANIDTIVSLAKRRGFVFPSSEIYGGTRSAWDYGPLGVELKENIRRQWWRAMVQQRDDIVGLDSAVDPGPRRLGRLRPRGRLRRPAHRVPLTATSGSAPTSWRRRSRPSTARPPTALSEINCPHCGTKGKFTEPRMFNGLMKTYLGPVENDEGLHYLRPETAQGIFVNFLNVMNSARKSRRSASPRSARASATRSHRATSSSGPASSSRWRWSSSSSPAPTSSGTSTGCSSAGTGTSTSGSTPDNLRLLRAPRGEALALLEAHGRHRVPVPVRRHRIR